MHPVLTPLLLSLKVAVCAVAISLALGVLCGFLLARALIRRPALLLLDEPFSALYTGLRAQMRSLVGELQREYGVPLLLITHDPADAEALGDEVFQMNRHDGHFSLQAVSPPPVAAPSAMWLP